MRSKKNVIVSLSVFIAVVLILTLFSQQPQRGALWDEINELKSRVTELETIVSGIKLGAPDYDSGWQAINQDDYLNLNHYLGTLNALVYVIGRNDSNSFHQTFYGFHSKLQYPTSIDQLEKYHGIHWRYHENQMLIMRASDDSVWEEVRVLIWKLD